MCTYSKCREYKFDEADGMINLFSMSLRKRPETTLTSQYEITKAIFNPFMPNIVVGATTSGYILQWDVRAKTTPISKSCLQNQKGGGHNHPVYGLQIVGTQSSHNIVSISNDGKVCQWAHGKLNEPIVNFNLQIKIAPSQNQMASKAGAKEDDKEDLAVTSLDFPEGESDKFFVGCEDFCGYQCNFHQLQDGQHLSKQYYGHTAPVTRIHSHPRASQSEYSGRSDFYQDLLLTSSMDWTVKLWSPKTKHNPPPPLMTFENAQEYIYDVEWSPVHPSIFACCDGDGFLEIWDLNRDTEGPIATKQTTKRTALNCLKWNADGRKIAVGDSEGYVNLWSLDKEIGQPKNEDFVKFEELIESQIQIVDSQSQP